MTLSESEIRTVSQFIVNTAMGHGFHVPDTTVYLATPAGFPDSEPDHIHVVSTMHLSREDTARDSVNGRDRLLELCRGIAPDQKVRIMPAFSSQGDTGRIAEVEIDLAIHVCASFIQVTPPHPEAASN